MSITFTISQANRLQVLTTWLDAATGEPLRAAFEAAELFGKLSQAYEAYRGGRLPLSEVRKHHKAMCDFLVVAARRHPGLRDF